MNEQGKMKTYQLTYHCDNCDHTGPVAIQFGTAAPEKATCTNCGCETAKRHKPIQVERRVEFYPSILPQITGHTPPVQPYQTPPKWPNEAWCDTRIEWSQGGTYDELATINELLAMGSR